MRRGILTLGVALAACGCALPGLAHVLSTSQGSLRLEGSAVHYELRMPLSEAPTGKSWQQDLLESFSLRVGETPGKRVQGACHEDPEQQLYICRSVYQFDSEPKAVIARCDYPSVSVPQHVHIVSSGEGETVRQTVFDIASREAEIRFKPPTRWEVLRSQFAAGARQAVTNPALLLFLAVLALAGRTRRELVISVAAFLLAETVAALVLKVSPWMLPSRFVEAAAALTVAYLATEILLLPEAQQRSLVCAGMGGFHGLFLGSFLRQTGMQPAWFLTGVLGCEMLLLAALGSLWLYTRSRRKEQILALLLLLCGVSWFVMRLQG